MADPMQQLERALRHHEAGRIDDAEAIYREVLAADPDHPDALHWLGLAQFQRRNFVEAADLMGRAVRGNSTVSAYWHNYGESLIAANRITDAIAAYRFAVDLEPNLGISYASLGVALRQTNNLPAAIEAFQNAIARGVQDPAIHRHLGEVLAMTGKGDEALAAFRDALALDPNSAETYHSVGVVFGRAGVLDKAIEAFQAALRIEPNHAQAHRGLAAIYHRGGKLEDAAREYDAAIAADPNNLEARMEFAGVLEKQNRLDDAAAQYREILRRKPDLVDVQYHLASVSNDRFAPARSPASYVAHYFNDYANTFDEHLLGKLKYRAPDLLFDAVCEVRGPVLEKMDILDLGCGTGLSGVAFKRLARTLSGIDLSSAMIEKAKARNIYDRLAVANLQSAFVWMQEQYDLILACDVLVYFGDLGSIFVGAAAHLHPRGYFAFTIELGDCKTYELRPTRRFVHSEAYIRELAQQNKLNVALTRQDILRTEHDVPVQGLVVVLQK
jgi:predicted TPR repeat methyltransferase